MKHQLSNLKDMDYLMQSFVITKILVGKTVYWLWFSTNILKNKTKHKHNKQTKKQNKESKRNKDGMF